MYNQYPPPGQQGPVPQPQQYYVYPQYQPYPYPQQQQQQQQPQPTMQHQQQQLIQQRQPQYYQQPQPQPQPQQQYQQPVPQQPPPPPQPQPAMQQQPPVASVRRSNKTNPPAVSQEVVEEKLDCCARTLKMTLILVVTTGFIMSCLAGASCEFMTFYREAPPSSESQSSSANSGGGVTPAPAIAIAIRRPSSTPTSTAAPSVTPVNTDANSSISIAVGQQELNPESNTSAIAATTNEPSLAPTTMVLQAREKESNPLDKESHPFSILPDIGNTRERRRLLLTTRSLQEQSSFEDWMPEYLQQLLVNTTVVFGIGIGRWAPDGTTCRKYEFDDEVGFDSLFKSARVGALVALIGSGTAWFILAAEYTCCRFFCSRLLVETCLVGALVGQCVTFLIYGTDKCTDPYTQAYSCDISTGSIYSITATVLHLIGAILVCPTPKSKPFLRVLVEKERKKEEVVDPCCWCFAGMCAKKSPPTPEEQVVAQQLPNTISDPERGQVAAAAAVGPPPPQQQQQQHQFVPVPVYYAPQPYPFPNEVQVQRGDSNLPSIPTQRDSSDFPQPSQPFPSEVILQTDHAVQTQEPFSFRQDAVFIPGDSMSVPGRMQSSGMMDHDSLEGGGGGGRSVKSQRSAYTNPEFYASDLFFDAPSVIDEEGIQENEYDDADESGSGNYEEPRQ